MKIDPILAEVFKKYGGDASKDLWDCHGTWVAYHKALERIAVQAKIAFDPPYIIESDGEKWSIAICVTGNMDGRSEWSIGEASQHNYKTRGKQTAFPYAMAEKRGKDRVILKLIGLHGLVYSEEEADDFKKKETKSAHQARKDGDWEELQMGIEETQTVDELAAWYSLNDDRIKKLPDNWRTHLREAYELHLDNLKARQPV